MQSMDWKNKKAIILCSRQCHEFAERDWAK